MYKVEQDYFPFRIIKERYPWKSFLIILCVQYFNSSLRGERKVFFDKYIDICRQTFHMF